MIKMFLGREKNRIVFLHGMKKFLPFSVVVISLMLAANFSFVTPWEKINTRADLGRKLFNEKLLSKDSSISCAGCHKPAFAFADTSAFSTGIFGKLSSRNTPSVLNMKNRPYYFWDGRAATLEEQALMPIENPDEMGLPIKEAVNRLNQQEEYRVLFKKIFRQPVTAKNLGQAFAAFEKTLETVDSKFDDWSNNLAELSDEEERGRQLFIGDKAKCFDCHSMEDFTDDQFKNIGLYNEKDSRDEGRYRITKNKNDLGKFKTPGLRNVAVTGPFMHDGRFKTLEQVVSYYNTPFMFVDDPVNIDSALREPLKLTPQEKKDLVAFLKTLTDKAYIKR
jgi:cytochrome c peroxidase